MAMKKAYCEVDTVFLKCKKLSSEIENEVIELGGEIYADLLALAYRQLIAAHKLAIVGEGKFIFISKERFSNGCAATVDVSYPSSPFFLLYNAELFKGMLRPIFKFALSDKCKFDFAPHDAGVYSLILGQNYGNGGVNSSYDRRYETLTSKTIGFRRSSVQGGQYIKLPENKFKYEE